jgi:phage terminase large subunit GpA-like protein
MVHTAGEIVLPTVEGSRASGAVLQARGITGGLRGLSAKRHDGTKHRPNLVLVDDPQSDEVANSPAQVAARLDVMQGAILGLAGPGKTIAGLCTITVIRPGDLADQLLDRTKHPAWQGERAALVYEWPTNEAIWKEYGELRREGQRTGAGTNAAHEFYLRNRQAMDAGARVAWPARFNPDEASAIEHAFNLRIDRGETAFFAEFQNAPLKAALETTALDKTTLRGRAIGLRRGVMPSDHSTITAAIDVQEKLLFWMVASWGHGFSGHVLAYGTHPDQPQSVFSAGAAKRTLAMAHPGGGFEATLLAGLTKLVNELLGRDWKREDGTTQRIEQLVIDANWGRSTQTVREFCRRHVNAAAILPAHGRGGGPTMRPLHEWKKKPGERLGPGWRVGTVGGQRGCLFDSDHWKSYVAGRLRTAIGDPGSLTFHEGDHELLVEHLAAERPITVEARGRVVDVWRLLAGHENHFLDALTMAAVAASIEGVGAVGAETSSRQRRRVELPKPGERRRIEVKRWGSRPIRG